VYVCDVYDVYVAAQSIPTRLGAELVALRSRGPVLPDFEPCRAWPAKPRDPWQTGKLAINELITWIVVRLSIARHVCHAWPRTWQTGKLVNNDYGCFRLCVGQGCRESCYPVNGSPDATVLSAGRQRLKTYCTRPLRNGDSFSAKSCAGFFRKNERPRGVRLMDSAWRATRAC
jgi:hypothetical protein